MVNLDLVISAQKGDTEAFAKLYLAYKDSLYRYAWYKLGNPNDAADAVSDTVLSAFEQIGKLKSPKAFSTYLYRIHNATCARYIKDIVKTKDNLDITELELSTDSTASQTALELREALSKLTDEEKDIVLLSVAGFSSKEIAQITGFTSGAIRSKLSRTYSKMRSFMEG